MGNSRQRQKVFLFYLFFPFFVFFTSLLGYSQTVVDYTCSPEQEKRLDWFRAAKFGMFIHWGLYAIPAGEWKGEIAPSPSEWIMLYKRIPLKEYSELAGRFHPEKFDADEWAGIAKQAGMKYLVITAKHLDGFAMYDSKVSEYDIVDATPFKRDNRNKDLSRISQVNPCKVMRF